MFDRDDLGAVAGVLFETCRTIGRLNPNQTLTALSAAIGITMAEAGIAWTDEAWADIGRAVKRVWEIESAPDDDDKIH